MKTFVKNNWFKIGILAIALILVYGYFTISNQPTLESNKNAENNNKNLSFDVDLNSLSYQLPKYDSICIPNKKYYCSKDGCEQMKPSVFVLIDYTNGKMFRCDNKPCDEYLVKVEESGEFLNINPLIPNGSFVKIEKGGNYFEVATLGLDTFASYGTCSGK